MRRIVETAFKQALIAWILLFILGGFVVAQENLGRGRIHGTILDESGAPVEGALVEAQSMQSDTRLEGQSDAKGRFAIGGLGGGMWRVRASKNGFASATMEIKVSQLSSNPAITLVLKKMAGMAALTSDKEAMTQFDRGNALLDQGDFDGALLIFQEFAGKYPELFQVHLNIGTCYLRKGDLDQAESEFKLVLDRAQEAGAANKDPAASLRALTGLGEIALRRDDLDAARKCFSRGLEISPQDETAAYNVGEILFSNQKIDEAIQYLELAARIRTDWPKPRLKLGYAYLNKGDLDRAVQSFNEFIRLAPEDPEVPRVKSMIETIEKMKKGDVPQSATLEFWTRVSLGDFRTRVALWGTSPNMTRP